MWYESGKLEDIDIDMMYELSDSAVQYVLPLVKSQDADTANSAKGFIEDFESNYKNHDLRNFNLSAYNAHKEVVKSGISILPNSSSHNMID